MAFRSESEAALAATADPSLLVSAGAYNSLNNPIKYSLSNRFAPTSTIITHCTYHRMPTSNLAMPYEVYTDATNGKDAKDIILRLDGSARTLDITQFNAGSWQKQDF